MNEKRLSVKELIAAYNREKDSDVVKRLMLVILAERDGMQRTKPRPVLEREMVQPLSQGGPTRTADKTAARQAAFCFQEGHEEDLEDVQEDRLLNGQRSAGSDQDGIRRRVRDLPRSRPAVWPRLYHEGPMDRHVHRGSKQKIAGFRRRMRQLIPGKGADGYIRYVQDETIVIADAKARRGVYTLKEKRAVYTYTGSHAKTVVFGLITNDGRSFFKRYDKFTKDEFADFLREAHVQFGKPNMLILDRAPQHKAKIIQEMLKDFGGAVELELLPPGCPDLNAIEEVWRQMKHAVLDTPS